MSWMVPGRLPQDGPEPILGPGVSKPHPHERTRMYRFEVKRPGVKALIVTKAAPSKAKGIMYCKNIWPDATITPLP